MAQELYTRTNQKLFFAGLAMESWARAEHEVGLTQRAAIQAHREATLFHLHGAVLSLCHEVAGFYRMDDAASSELSYFLAESTQAAFPSAELAELAEVAGNAETWLAQLLAAYEALQRPPLAPQVRKTIEGEGIIGFVEVQREAAELARDEVEEWRNGIKDMARRFRAGMTEW